MSNSKSVASAMSWLIAGRFGNLAFSLLSTAVLARFLKPQDFGLMVTATITVALANAVFDGAFGIGLVRKIDLDDDHIAATMGSAVVTGLFLTVAVIAAAPLLERFYKFPGLTLIVAATSVVLLFKAVFAVSTALLQRRGDFRSIAVVSVISVPAGSLAVSVPMALAGFGVWALVAGTVASGAFEAIGSLIAARPPLRLKLARASFEEVRGVGGLFALNQVLNWAALSGASIVTGHLLGAHTLGVYSRGWRLLDIAVSATAGPMQRVFMPLFARLQTDLNGARTSFLANLNLLGPIFAILGALACLHAKAIVLLLLGPQWLETIPVTQILFSALVARCLYKLSEGVTIAFGKAAAAARRQAIYAVLMIVGAVIGSHFGPSGVAAAASGAVWVFYALSISFAVTLLGCSGRALFLVHFRMVAWVAVTIACHLIAAKLLAPLGFWTRDILAGLLCLAVLVALFALAPLNIVGEHVYVEREKLLRRWVWKNRRPAPELTDITYVYGQPLPNTSANAVAVLSLADALQRLGRKVSILYPGDPASAETLRSAYGCQQSIRFKNVKVPNGALRYPVFALAGILASPGAVIITRMPQVAVLTALFGRRCILELHQHLETFLHWSVWGQLFRLNGRRQLVVAALTPAIKAGLDAGVMKGVTVHIIPSGANDYGAVPVKPAYDVGYVGSLQTGKGIEIVAEIAEARPNISFVVYGKHENNPAMAERLRAIPNVKLAGHVTRDEMQRTLHSFSIGVAPYSSDGFGGEHMPFVSQECLSSLKIAEYLSASRVVVSSRINAIELMVQEDVEALLCDPHKFDDWLEALDRLLGDPDLSARLAQAGRRRFETDFTMPRRAEMFLEAAGAFPSQKLQ